MINHCQTLYYIQQLKSLVRLKHYRTTSKTRTVIFLQQKENSELLRLLTLSSFFEFNKTNNGFIIGEAQLIAFCFCGGYKAYLRGITISEQSHEIHHYDSNCLSNIPSNLCYLSRDDHHAVTLCSTNVGFYQEFKQKRTIPGSTQFTRTGKLVHDSYHYLLRTISRTLLSSYTWIENIKPHLVFNLKKTLFSLGKLITKSCSSIQDILNLNLQPHYENICLFFT